MHLRLTRLDQRRYESEIIRSDGVTFRVTGVGHMGVIPHDLAHFVVEQALGIRQGFWGSVAAGAIFDSLTHLSGRRRPHSDQKSRDILRRNRGVLTETEIIVGLFDQAFEDGLGDQPSRVRARLERFRWTPPGHPPRVFTDAQVSKACTSWGAMLEAWKRLEIGDTIDLHWPED